MINNLIKIIGNVENRVVQQHLKLLYGQSFNFVLRSVLRPFAHNALGTLFFILSEISGWEVRGNCVSFF